MIFFSLFCNFCSCFLWYPDNNWLNYKSSDSSKKHLYSRGIGVFLILISIVVSSFKIGLTNSCILQFLVACIITSLIIILYPVRLLNSIYIVLILLLGSLIEFTINYAS
jgi:hypothetical protein